MVSDINQPMHISHTNTILYCHRFRETVRFYRKHMRLPVLLEKAWFVEFELTDTGRLSVADAQRSSIASAGGSGLTLSWRVENVDDVHARWAARGLGVTPVKRIWGSKTCFIFDPEGNRIELWS